MLEIADGRVMTSEVMCIDQKNVDGATAVLAVLRPVGAGSEAQVDIFSSNYGLSRREQEVVHLLVQGLTTVAMADQLGISPHTVRDHLKHLYRKTKTNSRSELLSLVAGGVQPRPARRASQKSAARRTNP
jgi:DNA-binding CsgD family transcriptional regulator